MPKKMGHIVTRPGRVLGHPSVTIPIPEELETVPGIPTREDDVSFFSREYPLENLQVEESASFDRLRELRKEYSLDAKKHYEHHEEAMGPIVEWVKATPDLEATATSTGEDVTESIRQKARELGYGEVGFTRFDRHYVYDSMKKLVKSDLPHAICLALEQDYQKTQRTPSLDSEDTHNGTYERQGSLTRDLVDHIRSLGYRAQASGPSYSYGPMIPMFVAAGLGQLGANGQLLSPHFGSWARLQIVLTDANVTYDQPVDYGIHKFCQICQVCVNRCPGRALVPEKVWYRGIEKNKLVFKRCQPIVSRYLSCGVCMKVCPIGQYGMKPVMEHYIETGQVLGKGTHALEGYTLGEKGYFGPGQLPQFESEIFKMPQGRSEDWMLIEFRDKLMESKEEESPDRDRLWSDFREKVEASIDRTLVTEMGMDIGTIDE